MTGKTLANATANGSGGRHATNRQTYVLTKPQLTAGKYLQAVDARARRMSHTIHQPIAANAAPANQQGAPA